MKNFLTQKEVSKEMLEVLEKLSNNISVPYEEICKLPEIKDAYKYLEDVNKPINYENRNELRENILNELNSRGSISYDENNNVSTNGEIRHEKRIDIVIGLPAAGKSSTLVEPISNIYGSRVIDSDEVKKLIPEYNNGWGAGKVHKESKDINLEILCNAVLKGENIVFPVVGSNIDKLERYIHNLKTMDYSVYLHYNELPMNKSLGRLISRYLEEGRFINPKIVYDYGNKVEKTYEVLKQKEGLLNGYSKFSNDVKRGEKPKLIEAINCKGGVWRNGKENELLSSNSNNVKRDDRGHGRCNVSMPGTISTREDSERRIRKEFKQIGCKPTREMISNMLKLQKICNKSIGVKDIKNLAKNGNGEIKNIADKIFKDIKIQQKHLER